MDLTDTWVEWHFYSKSARELFEQNPRLRLLHCGLCDDEVAMDDDFDVYSTALEVIEDPVDDGPRAAGPDGLLAQLLPAARRGRMVESKIICLPCIAARLPALATWVADFRRLRATRDALLGGCALKG